MIDEPLPAARCEELFGIVQREARTRGTPHVEVMLTASDSALTRFSNNAIHQNVSEKTHALSVRVLIDGRTARASTNRLDENSIRDVVEQAIAITRAQEPDPELLPLAEAASYIPVNRFFQSTAEATPRDRAQAVAEAIQMVEAESQIAAGIYATGYTTFAILNSRGIFGRHVESMAQFSITAMAEDSSGWAKLTACDRRDLDHAALAKRAAQKAAASRSPVECSPGRHTVILEPAAALDVVGQIFGDFSATALRDGRSFLVDRVGKKLFGENITIRDDVYHPQQAGPPFDWEGVPRQVLRLVERGVPSQVAMSRQAALVAGAAPTGHGYPLPNEVGEAPVNLVIEGGKATLDEMIASTERGILVTRLWYIREVDPYEKIMTGMTRDGTFLVEDGEVKRGVRNFRFNQGVIELLSNVEALSATSRASGEEAPDMVAPAMKVRDFNFTEVTRF